jgi:signal transduction histidine kinase
MFATLAFVAVGGTVIGLIYWTMLSSLDSEIDGAVSRDCAEMAFIYDHEGYAGLRTLVAARSSRQPDARRLYLLKGPGGELSGNLRQWPGTALAAGVFTDVTVNHPAIAARVRAVKLGEDTELLVGHSLADRSSLQTLATRSLLLACAVYLLLGAGSGVLIMRYARRRLEAINAAAHKVFDGDLSARVKTRDGGDEYDHLAKNFNAMLDRIQRLVVTVRGVTENIAHDLRAPLNRMRSRLELALMSARTPEEYRAVLDRAISETENIVETFNGMLKMARMTSGSLAVPQDRVDLTEVAAELLDLYYVFAEENNILLDLELPASGGTAPMQVFGDGHLISQAAANLLDNAIKYSTAGGRVSIEVTKNAGRVSFTIADEGPGIPENKRTEILERFVRLEGAASKPGFGLGLSFVMAVAEWHKAQLTLSSNNPGLRATLTFAEAPQASVRSGLLSKSAVEKTPDKRIRH